MYLDRINRGAVADSAIKVIRVLSGRRVRGRRWSVGYAALTHGLVPSAFAFGVTPFRRHGGMMSATARAVNIADSQNVIIYKLHKTERINVWHQTHGDFAECAASDAWFVLYRPEIS